MEILNQKNLRRRKNKIKKKEQLTVRLRLVSRF